MAPQQPSTTLVIFQLHTHHDQELKHKNHTPCDLQSPHRSSSSNSLRISDSSSYLELDLLAFLCVGHCDTNLSFLRALTGARMSYIMIKELKYKNHTPSDLQSPHGAFLCIGYCNINLLFLRALTTFPAVNYTVLSRAYLSIPSLTSVHQSVSVSITPLLTTDDASGRYRRC